MNVFNKGLYGSMLKLSAQKTKAIICTRLRKQPRFPLKIENMLQNMYQTFIFSALYWIKSITGDPLWNFSSRNRVTRVSVQDGVQLGIMFAAISTIPAELSPIPAALSLSAGADAATAFVARLAKHKTLLNIVKHHETHVKHCKTS